MIPIASGVRVWIATGHTDMRRGMNSLALLVQEAFKRDPHGGDLYVFRGKSGQHATFCIQSSKRDNCISVASLFGRTLQVAPFRRGVDPGITINTSPTDFAPIKQAGTYNCAALVGDRPPRAIRTKGVIAKLGMGAGHHPASLAPGPDHHDPVLASCLHPIGWHRPDFLVQVDLGPPRTQYLAGTNSGQNAKLDG